MVSVCGDINLIPTQFSFGCFSMVLSNVMTSVRHSLLLQHLQQWTLFICSFVDEECHGCFVWTFFERIFFQCHMSRCLTTAKILEI